MFWNYWLVFLRYLKNLKTSTLIIAAILFGFSVMTKHILLFFPLWINLIIWHKQKSFKNILIFNTLVYGLFFGGFVFEIIRFFDQRDAIINGIIKNVFMYRGYGFSSMTRVVNLFVPLPVLDSLNYMPLFKGYNFIYVISLLFYGYLVVISKIAPKYYLPLYLLAFFAFAPSEAPQYLIIPLITVSIFYNRLETLVFYLIGFIYVSFNYFTDFYKLTSQPIEIGFIKLYPVVDMMAASGSPIQDSFYKIIQGWLILMAVSLLIKVNIKNSNSMWLSKLTDFYRRYSFYMLVAIVFYSDFLLLLYLSYRY